MDKFIQVAVFLVGLASSVMLGMMIGASLQEKTRKKIQKRTEEIREENKKEDRLRAIEDGIQALKRQS